MFNAKNKVAIVGVGHSKVARRQERPLGLLAVDAAMAAINDAGLTPSDIDGAATHPVLPAYAGHSGGGADGSTYVSTPWMIGALRLNVDWWGQPEIGNVSTAIGAAIDALATGCCNYVIIWRALHQPAGAYQGLEKSHEARGDAAYNTPYGIRSAVLRYAPNYLRYLKSFGAKREHLATYVLAARKGANLNPKAFFYDKPLTLDEYMSARMIADPMCLFDCDIPVDGAGAIVLTTAERAKDLPNPPAYITGYGQAGYKPLAATPDEQLRYTAESLGRGLWESSGLRPEDMNGAMLYDGFAPNIYFWLEGLGFCKMGEAFEYIQGGRIDLGGSLPINTFGGSLSEGRLHGIGHWVEGTLQIQGRADERQIAGAENVLVTTGLTSHGSGAILSKSPR